MISFSLPQITSSLIPKAHFSEGQSHVSNLTVLCSQDNKVIRNEAGSFLAQHIMWNTYTTFYFNIIFFLGYIFAFADTLLSSLTFVSLFFFVLCQCYIFVELWNRDFTSWLEVMIPAAFGGVWVKLRNFFFFFFLVINTTHIKM